MERQLNSVAWQQASKNCEPYNRVHFFESTNLDIPLPERFPNPFDVHAHPLAKIAAKELQSYLEMQVDWAFYFGLQDHNKIKGLGKMFGVLVVETTQHELGYLAAFSGKLFHTNDHPYFVPPIFDMLQEKMKKETFYQAGERHLYAMSEQIAQLEQLVDGKRFAEQLINLEIEYNDQRNILKKQHREAKIARKEIRDMLENRSPQERKQVNECLNRQSIHEHFQLKDLKRNFQRQHEQISEKLIHFQQEILSLKHERRRFSQDLQDQLFSNYHFLNARGECKNVLELFVHQGKPPAGAGECCAPKLLQYAYQNNLKPIAIAEFWWGKSPQSEIRKHKQFYPACRGKCLPILNHMLDGISCEAHSTQRNQVQKKTLCILYEDEHLLAIDKPSELLSVPGKTPLASAFDIVKDYLPDNIQPWMVHRLDMSTSGILLIAKNKDIYVNLQQQFAQQTIKKRYVAILNGILKQAKGEISLPLRVDLDDRPRQLVCFEHGKSACTFWERIGEENGTTKVYFYPTTGRTHQLRIHAAHHLGLNAPIVGDNLYGTPSKRLYLHAEQLTFTHPETKKMITLHAKAPF